MKKKYADHPNWSLVDEKSYENKHFNTEDFTGNISLLTAVKVKEKIVKERNGKEYVYIDDNFHYLEFYPETNKNVAIMVAMDQDSNIRDWYFDIAKDSKLTDKGVPYIDDLYLDIILERSGKYRLVDEDELQEALDEGKITKEDYDLAYKTANYLIEQFDGKMDRLIDFTYKYLQKFKHVELGTKQEKDWER